MNCIPLQTWAPDNLHIYIVSVEDLICQKKKLYHIKKKCFEGIEKNIQISTCFLWLSTVHIKAT